MSYRQQSLIDKHLPLNFRKRAILAACCRQQLICPRYQREKYEIRQATDLSKRPIVFDLRREFSLIDSRLRDWDRRFAFQYSIDLPTIGWSVELRHAAGSKSVNTVVMMARRYSTFASYTFDAPLTLHSASRSDDDDDDGDDHEDG